MQILLPDIDLNSCRENRCVESVAWPVGHSAGHPGPADYAGQDPAFSAVRDRAILFGIVAVVYHGGSKIHARQSEACLFDWQFPRAKRAH